MKTILKIGFLSFISMMTLLGSTETEVEELVNKANVYCEKVGIEECSKAFTAKDPEFTKGDLYIFVSTFSGNLIAHGANASLIGKDLSKVKSPSGIFPGIEMGKIAKEKGSGWIEYKWSHPVTKKVADKRTYVKKFQNTEILIGSGYYK